MPLDIDPELDAMMDLIVAIRDKQRREREAADEELNSLFAYLDAEESEYNLLHGRPDNFPPEEEHDAMRWADDGGYVND